MTIRISSALAVLMVSQISQVLQAGPNAARLAIYDGTIPASADIPISEEPELVSFDLLSPVFGEPVETENGVELVAEEIGESAATETGTAKFFRLYDGEGVAHVQGTVSTAGQGGDAIVNSTAVVSGTSIIVASLTVRQRTS